MQLNPTIQPVSSKGQVVIPLAYRRYLKIKPRGKVLLSPLKGQPGFIIQPIQEPIKALTGILKEDPQTALQIKDAIRKEENIYEQDR